MAEAAEPAESAGDLGSGRQRAVGLAIALGAAVTVWVAPIPITEAQHRLLAIFVAVMVLWVSEALPIPVTALAIAPAMIAAGICNADAAFAPYADPLLYLFIGGFMLARAMTRHGLDRRVAFAIVKLPLVRGRARLAFFVTAFLISMWISNTATAAIVMPIALGALGATGKGKERVAAGTVLGVAFASSFGGMGTLIGSTPNLIVARFIQESGARFGFLEWLYVGFPTAVALGAMSLVVFSRTHPEPKGAVEAAAPPELGPMSRGEKITAGCFALAVIGWVVPSLLAAAKLPFGEALDKALPGGAVGVLAALPMFFVADAPGGKRAVLPWEDAAKIDWGIILLFGGGISLGDQLAETGLARVVAETFVSSTGVSDLWTLTALTALVALLLTEVASNTATANMLAPIVIAVAERLHVSPIPPALAIGFAASCGFMLPVATGPNAIAYGTGKVDLRDMIRTGILLDLISVVIIVVILRLLCPLVGLV